MGPLILEISRIDYDYTLWGTFSQPFCRDLCFVKQFRFQARGTFGEPFCRDLCFGNFGFRPRVRSVRHFIEIEPISQSIRWLKISYPTTTSEPHFTGLLWPFVFSHVWLVTHSVDHFPYRMGVPSINPISKGYSLATVAVDRLACGIIFRCLCDGSRKMDFVFYLLASPRDARIP